MAKRSTHTDKGSHHLTPLLLRLTVGPTIFVHGYNKVFGEGGLEGTERWFASTGFKPAAVHARVAAATEMGAGALITLGAMNPLPSAGVIGVMTVAAATEHKGKGFFVFKNGWEYTAVLAGAALALAASGNGRWSVDHVLGRRRRGWRPAFVAATLGVANAAAVLKLSYRPETDAPAPAATEPDAPSAVADASTSSTSPSANGTASGEEVTAGS